jgi:transcriptional regulator with XRE-family HTH domain
MRLALKVAILASGMTQRDLSVKSRVPEVRLSAIVRGRAEPSEDEQAAIREALNSTDRELFQRRIAV